MLLHGSMTAILTEENLGSVPKYIIKCKRLIFATGNLLFIVSNFAQVTDILTHFKIVDWVFIDH